MKTQGDVKGQAVVVRAREGMLLATGRRRRRRTKKKKFFRMIYNALIGKVRTFFANFSNSQGAHFASKEIARE